MIKTRIIDLRLLAEDTKTSILETIIRGTSEDLVEDVEYILDIKVTSADVRRQYVLGLASSEFTSEYDLFRTKSTTTKIKMRNLELHSVVIETEY